MCSVLPIAPPTYDNHLAKRTNAARLSDRARRDAALRPEIRRVFEENWRGCGGRRIWRQLGREGFDIARCTVARLMKGMGIQGAIRGKPHRTTIPDKKAPCPLDKVNRQFQGPAPNRLWVSDLTCVATWKGFVYVAFVLDAAASSAGGSARRLMRVSSPMLWNRRCMIAAPQRAWALSLIATGAANMCQSNTQTSWQRRASRPRAEASVTAVTLRWPRL
ncbi:hypothetical protein EG244_14465, partial [Falsigemmobacter faecalis]